MGALAGHLAHLQENLDFTFGELKDILGSVAAGETPVVEKVDGQNIFFKISVDPATGELRTARNAGDLNKGGMSPEEFSAKWTGHPAESAFMNGFGAIDRALSGMNANTLKDIFTPASVDGQRFINAEIVYTGNPNVINYGGDYIVMHNLQEFDENGKLVDVQLQGAEFQNLVQGIEDSQKQMDNESWKVIGPQITKLQDLSATDIQDKFNSKLSALGVTDSMTLGDFVENRLRDQVVGRLAIPVHKQEKIVKRILGLGQGLSDADVPNLKDIKAGLSKEAQKKVSALATKVNSQKTVGAVLAPVELAIHDFATEVLSGLSSALSDDHDNEISRLKMQLDDAKEKIMSARDDKSDARREMLTRQLNKLGDPSNIASSIEGIVFEHPPGSKALYKLTGAFAPLNQIIGASYRIPKNQSENLIRRYVKGFLAG